MQLRKHPSQVVMPRARLFSVQSSTDAPADDFSGCDYVSPDMINNQVVKLNQAFNPSNFNFQLATTDYTNRTLWCGLCRCSRKSGFLTL
jgi:hypothetical protein